jgi:hypothetical protein
MAKIFSMDRTKDLKLIDKIYTIKGIGEEGIDLRGKFKDIDASGYYKFEITSRNTDYEEYLTLAPNSGDITE